MVGLTLFVSRTQLGRAMRAVASDRQAAEMMGIDVNRVIAVTFFIGSALAGAAGVMSTASSTSRSRTYMGFHAGLKAFTAAVVGGIGNIPGAMVGGLSIGLAESFTIGYISSTFSDAIVFVHPDRGDDRAPERPVRARRRCRRSDGRAPIGVDESGRALDDWVASVEQRRGAARRRSRAVGSARRLVAAARCSLGVVAFARPPLDAQRLHPAGVGFDTLIYMLLALGLNIVVGWAGLLDLGYIAFFGFGAYGYAMLSSLAVRQPRTGRPRVDPARDRRARDRVALAASSSRFAPRAAARRATTSRS